MMRWVDTFPLCRDACRTWVLGLAGAAVFAVILDQFWRYRWSVQRWDLLLISGLAVFVLGIWLVGRTSTQFHLCLVRLHDRGAIRLADNQLRDFIADLDAQADRWARVCGPLIALVIAAGFAFVLWNEFFWWKAILGVAETIMGYIVGGYLGRMASHGRLGRILRQRHVAIALNPWHADRAGGLKPVGDFCFMQAMIIALPAAFLAAWLLLIPVWPKDYSEWQEPYLAFLAIVIVFEVLSFLWPLWSFHIMMVDQKNHWRAEVDRLYRDHAKRHKDILERGIADDKGLQSDVLDSLGKCYSAVERLPAWPVDLRLGLRFAANNLLLVLPLAGDLLSQGLHWPKLLQLLGTLVGDLAA